MNQLINWIKKYAVAVMALVAFSGGIVGGYEWWSAQTAMAQQVAKNTKGLSKIRAKMELRTVTPLYYEAKKVAKANPDDIEAQEEFEDLKTRRAELKKIILGK